jgi:4'-phosphopantetheinyl transferase EntD
MPDQRSLDAALHAVAPAGVRVGWRTISDHDVSLLHPVEAVSVERAVPKRRREFATGRVLLRDLIGTSAAIPVGGDRAPVFPDGVVASLAHDDVYAVAAASDLPDLALGVDVEPSGQLDDRMSAMILRPDETGLDAHLAFALKEAAYKTWSSCGGRMLEHHDVRITVAASEFTAEVVADAVLIRGRYSHADDRWVVLAVAPRVALSSVARRD